MQDEYKVQLEIFEGPLDLLLYLAKKDEVDIHDVRIERLTDQYLEYMESFKMLNIALASEFVVMAANLIYIKSRTLLPKHQQPPEEEGDEEDPRWDLIRQLIEYKKFKDAAGFLQHQAEHREGLFDNNPEEIETDEPVERPLADVGIFDLIRAFQTVVERFENSAAVGEVFDDRFTVSDKIDHLLTTVPAGTSIRFADLFEGAGSKGEVIVTFLALLELMKLNHFSVQQDSLLGEIELHRNENL